ncbi:uncharacterized protein BCR38DRAFT_501415, partial [Pseudomassariella vexata]
LASSGWEESTICQVVESARLLGLQLRLNGRRSTARTTVMRPKSPPTLMMRPYLANRWPSTTLRALGGPMSSFLKPIPTTTPTTTPMATTYSPRETAESTKPRSAKREASKMAFCRTPNEYAAHWWQKAMDQGLDHQRRGRSKVQSLVRNH